MFHQAPPDRTTLNIWVDRDGANAPDQGAFVEDVAPHDPAILFGHGTVIAVMADQMRNEIHGVLDRGHVGGVAVPPGNIVEGPETDLSTGGGIVWPGFTYGQTHWAYSGMRKSSSDKTLRHPLVP
jgi:hypothetical protein